MLDKQFEEISLSELALLATTRVTIGVGLGLILANKLSPKHRAAIGIPLFVAGVLTTIPIAIHLFDKQKNKTVSYGKR